MISVAFRNTHDVVEEIWSPADLDQLRPEPDSVTRFRERFADMGGLTGEVVFAASGRQALRQLLARLPRRPERRDVLLSAFNCPVVPDAVRAAGYRPVFYDFSSVRGNVDWDQVATDIGGSVAAVIVSHFFGAPADAEALRERTQKAGVFVIEDCAHAFDASIRGAPVGSLWDAAVFSFNYGKPISLCGGAALVLNAAALRGISMPCREADESVERDETAAYLKALSAGRRAIAPVVAPLDLVRRILRRMRIMTPLTPPLASGFGPLRAALGLASLSRWREVRAVRNANADLVASCGIPLWHVTTGAQPSWLRLRATLRDESVLREASTRLRSRGFRAGNINWPKIDPDCGPAPWARQAARCGIDVPIHQNMSADEIAFIIEVLAPLVEPVT
ncbi:DegT/DnrJ/EryC1/StrS family aminotransferase [Dyella humi]|uniref:DegT/DnrJ/EryC1/StrS family aminotransferase n=1 Tax=Dyella humi TaxID=1770547 RepID=A0ABW8IFI2_9GAMM